jgi:hypothetical protein
VSKLKEEMKVISAPVWALAVTLGLGVAALFWMTVVVPGGIRPAGMLIVGLIAAVVSIYVLIISYIAEDARRRGMPVLMWTLLAIFIPSAIGIILYFILRRPLLRACSKCGTPADATFTFCPSCGATLGKTCPACHSSVESAWAHCPKCGGSLNAA